MRWLMANEIKEKVRINPNLIVLTALIPDKMLLLVSEKHIKGGQGTIAAGDVLLNIHFFFILQCFAAVDVLFQHPEPVPQHNDLMKEILDGNFLRLECFVSRLKQHHAPYPFIAQRNGFGDATPHFQDLQQ